jgi:hypothetical protein
MDPAPKQGERKKVYNRSTVTNDQLLTVLPGTVAEKDSDEHELIYSTLTAIPAGNLARVSLGRGPSLLFEKDPRK